MYPELCGKTALITGAGKKTGIGFAIAQKLAQCGSNVVIADLVDLDPSDPAGDSIDCAKLADLAEDLSREHDIQAAWVGLDVTSGLSITQMTDAVISRFGGVQILCNNAGTVFGVPNTLHTYDEAAWLKTLDVNLNGVFRVSQAIIPFMLKTGGSIINMASRAAKVPPLFNGAYAVAKAGVVMLTKVMARELAGSGIRVNAVCPGVISTDFTAWRFNLEAQVLDSTVEDREAAMIQTIPAGRLGSPREVANLVGFLASDQSSYTTGQAINVTGGQLMEL